MLFNMQQKYIKCFNIASNSWERSDYTTVITPQLLHHSDYKGMHGLHICSCWCILHQAWSDLVQDLWKNLNMQFFYY